MIRTSKRPRLAVTISIDLLRADLLTRLSDQFLPATGPGGSVGGFRYLMERGAWFIDARYGHFPLETGPGHAVILTGGYPYKTGIVANDWWDRENRRAIYCVDDPRQRVVGARSGSGARPMGPLNLRSTTVGDELKMATGGAAKVVSLALKDRAAILMGGHAPDVAIWFDETKGNWISSTAYFPGGALPSWVEELNGREIPEKTLGSTWASELSDVAMKRTVPAAAVFPVYGMGNRFPHTIGSERTATNYKAFRMTPDATRYVLATAMEGITKEGLGADEIPDLLAVGLSSIDYAEHGFGPHSPEVFDLAVRVDRQLAEFFGFLERTVPGGLSNVVIALTADHGGSMVPETASEKGIGAGRVLRRDVMKAAHQALVAAYGDDVWLSIRQSTWNLDSVDVSYANGGYVDPYLYLDDRSIERALAARKAGSRAEIEETAARAVEKVPAVYTAYPRSRIVNGMLPPVETSRHIANGFYPKVSGDILLLTEQNYIMLDRSDQYAATHGTPYIYDIHVPVFVAGSGIVSGVYTATVSPADVAPTLSALLGISYPSACDGRLLRDALR